MLGKPTISKSILDAVNSVIGEEPVVETKKQSSTMLSEEFPVGKNEPDKLKGLILKKKDDKKAALGKPAIAMTAESKKRMLADDELDETGFHMAAHAAKKSGAAQFEFQGKKYPVTAKSHMEEYELDEEGNCVTPMKAKKIADKEVGKHEKKMHNEEKLDEIDANAILGMAKKISPTARIVTTDQKKKEREELDAKKSKEPKSADVSHQAVDFGKNKGYGQGRYMGDSVEMSFKDRLLEKSVSTKQARTMAAAAHNPKFAKKVGIPQDVAKDFNQADKGTKMLSKAMSEEEVLDEKDANFQRYKKIQDKIKEQGVAEGSEHNVGGISHSIIKHPGGKHQVVVKHGDKVAHTSLHNSEEDAKKSLASQVAYSKKMLKVYEQGVAEEVLDEKDELRGRIGTNIVNKKPRQGQTDLRNIPVGNRPDSKRKFSQSERDSQPSRLKNDIKASLGKHTKPNLPEESEMQESLKDVAKKVLSKVGGGSDKDQLKKLQKNMGVPQTGEKPKNEEVKDEYARKVDEYLKKKYKKEEVVDEAESPFTSYKDKTKPSIFAPKSHTSKKSEKGTVYTKNWSKKDMEHKVDDKAKNEAVNKETDEHIRVDGETDMKTKTVDGLRGRMKVPADYHNKSKSYKVAMTVGEEVVSEEHDDEKEDKALVKKMVKKDALKKTDEAFKGPEAGSGTGDHPFVTAEAKPLKNARELAKKTMHRIKNEMLGKISN